MVNIDGCLFPALIDTGSSISILSLTICKRLKKVLLPPEGPVLKSAFNTLAAPIANCTARLLIGNQMYIVDFRVLSLASHDIILGCDFLSENEAIIDYVKGEVSLNDETCVDIPPAEMSSKLRVVRDTIVPPHSTLFVALVAHHCSPFDILLEPHRDALAKKGLFAPFCLSSVDVDQVFLPVTNSLAEPVLLPVGFVAASMDICRPRSFCH